MRLRPAFILPFLLLAASAAGAVEGLVVLDSPYGVDQTMERLVKSVSRAGFTIMARVNHAEGAAKAGLRLPPEQLLIFGKPKAGTLLMQKSPTAGIDLPMKYLVWRDAAGQVHVAWNDPAWIAARHGIHGRDELIRKMQGALRGLAEKALRH